jgi:predicted ABC-type transport system involved in lysophospholipase L1 biosynthesis ATPase subunit
MTTPVLSCEEIGYVDQGLPLFAGVTFHLERGQRVALLADPHRHGTILLKICASLISPSSGEIAWFGRGHEGMKGRERYELRRRIGLVYRESSLISNMAIVDNVTLGIQYHENLTRDAAYAQVSDLLGRFGLSKRRFHRPADLTPEERRLALYVRELVKKPEIFLLESPSLDLGEGSQSLLMKVLEEAASGSGCAILVGNVEPETARRWGDRVLILQAGRCLSLEAGEFDPLRYTDSARKRAGERSMV